MIYCHVEEYLECERRRRRESEKERKKVSKKTKDFHIHESRCLNWLLVPNRSVQGTWNNGTVSFVGDS